jgi:lipopolysaccharide export system permease protein
LIIDRYIAHEIGKPMVVICTVLIAIFASYSAAEYLADAVSGLFPPGAVLLMLVLRIAIALEVLLPTTLYLSVVIALGRMYRDSEMVALASCGVGLTRILRSVLYLALVVALLVAGLSIFARPWAYKKVYDLKTLAKEDFDISRMEAGNFYEIKSSHMVIFAEEVDHKNNRVGKVFMRIKEGDKLKVISARKVYQPERTVGGRRPLLLRDGYFYEFKRDGTKGKITQFAEATYLLESPAAAMRKYKRRAASTAYLMRSDKREDIAELQWRLSTAISTILLALLGVPLSRTTPRQGKYLKLVAAVIIFAVYYNITVVAKNWIEKGVLTAIPGIWWVPAGLAGCILVLLWKSGEVFRRRQR